MSCTADAISKNAQGFIDFMNGCGFQSGAEGKDFYIVSSDRKIIIKGPHFKYEEDKTWVHSYPSVAIKVRDPNAWKAWDQTSGIDAVIAETFEKNLKFLVDTLRSKGLVCGVENADIFILAPGKTRAEDRKFLLEGYLSNGGWESERMIKRTLEIEIKTRNPDAWI